MTDNADTPLHDRVASVVGQIIGMPCEDVIQLTGGISSSGAFALRAGEKSIVVKFNPDVNVLRHGRRNLATLSSIGVPVPTCVGYSETPDGAWLVMDRLAGTDLGNVLDTLTRAQMTELARHVIDIERRVSGLPANTGCGFLGLGEVATRPWRDVVERPNGYQWADPLPPDVAPLVPRLFDLISAAGPYLDGITGTCFLDDLTTKNVMVDNGQLSGVVDFDVVCYGDPLFQIGLTAAAVIAGFPARCRFYVEELVRFAVPSPEGRAAIKLYTARFLVSFLAAELPNRAGPWRAAAISAAAECLADAESFQWVCESS